MWTFRTLVPQPRHAAALMVAISVAAMISAVIAEYGFGKSMNDCASGICWFQRAIYIAVGLLAFAMFSVPARRRAIVIMLGCVEIVILLAGVGLEVMSFCVTSGTPWSFFGIPVESYNRVIYGFMIFLILISFFSKPNSEPKP